MDKSWWRDGLEHLLPWLRLQLTPGLGRVGLMRLIERFKTPEKAIDNGGDWHLAGLRNSLARAIPASSDSKVHKACERLDEIQGRRLTIWGADYPQRLTQTMILRRCSTASANFRKNRHWPWSAHTIRPTSAEPLPENWPGT